MCYVNTDYLFIYNDRQIGKIRIEFHNIYNLFPFVSKVRLTYEGIFVSTIDITTP